MINVNYPVLQILTDKRFNRDKSAKPMFESFLDYFAEGAGSLVAYLQKSGRAERLQRELYLNGSFGLPRTMYVVNESQACCPHCHEEQKKLEQLIRLTQEELEILERIIADWTYYETMETTMRRIGKINQLETFADAVNFVYSRLGLPKVDFKLRDPHLINVLDSRINDLKR